MTIIQAVLFDLDGTLVDSNEAHVEVWRRVFAAAGHPIAADAIRGQIGKGGDNLVPALVPGTPDDEVERWSDEHGRIFKAEYLDTIRPFPQAAALVRRVAETGRRAVLASSASKAELKHYTDLLGIGDVIAASTSIDDVGTSKPAPDIFEVALGKLRGVGAAQAIVVGDSPFDMEGASRAGIPAIGLLSGGFDEAALREAGAGAVYADAAALLAAFNTSPLGA